MLNMYVGCVVCFCLLHTGLGLPTRWADDSFSSWVDDNDEESAMYPTRLYDDIFPSHTSPLDAATAAQQQQRLIDELGAIMTSHPQPIINYANAAGVTSSSSSSSKSKRTGKLSMRLSMEVLRDMLRAKNSRKQSESLIKLANLGK